MCTVRDITVLRENSKIVPRSSHSNFQVNFIVCNSSPKHQIYQLNFNPFYRNYISRVVETMSPLGYIDIDYQVC